MGNVQCISVSLKLFLIERYSTGWDELSIVTNSSFDDVTQAKAAGFLEVRITGNNFIDFYLRALLL